MGIFDFIEKGGEIKVKLSDGEFVKTKYLIAADGAKSMIRKKLGIKVPALQVRIVYLLVSILF